MADLNRLHPTGRAPHEGRILLISGHPNLFATTPFTPGAGLDWLRLRAPLCLPGGCVSRDAVRKIIPLQHDTDSRHMTAAPDVMAPLIEAPATLVITPEAGGVTVRIRSAAHEAWSAHLSARHLVTFDPIFPGKQLAHLLRLMREQPVDEAFYAAQVQIAAGSPMRQSA